MGYDGIGESSLEKCKEILKLFPGTDIRTLKTIDGTTMLHRAAKKLSGEEDHLEIVRELLNAGAEIDATDGRKESLPTGWESVRLQDGQILYIKMPEGPGSEATPQVSLEKPSGETVTEQTEPDKHHAGRTALHYAVREKCLAIVELLLKEDANPN